MERSRPTSPAIAFAVACLGIAVYSGMDTAMKRLTLASGVYAALMWRSVLGTILSGILHFARRPRRPSARALRLHVERGAVVTVMALLFFWGLARVPMAQAIALCFIAPLMAIGLAALLLGERIGRRALLASGIAFAGVAVIIAGQAHARMGPDAFRGALAVLAAACAYAYNLILMRQQGDHSDAVEVAFFQNLVAAVLLLACAPLIGVLPTGHQLPAVLAAAVFGTAAGVFLAWAYARAGAARLAPSEYTGLIWSILFGWLFFAEVPQVWTLAGAVLIVAGCLLAARDGNDLPPEAAL